jgi:hypothetical protein
MDAITFGFVVLPGVLCLVGFVFSAVFCTDIIRWISEIRAAEAKARGYPSPDDTVGHEFREDPDPYESQSRTCPKVKELVG